jgi:hypothetical protein
MFYRNQNTVELSKTYVSVCVFKFIDQFTNVNNLKQRVTTAVSNADVMLRRVWNEL